MAIKGKEKSTWGLPAGKDASEIMLDGYLRLAAAVVVRAVKDYWDRDILRALDAYFWLRSDGPIWLEMLELVDQGNSPDAIFLKIAEGAYVRRKQFIQSGE